MRRISALGTSGLAALAAAGTLRLASATVTPANAMGPLGPSASQKSDASLVQTVGRRYYRRSYYYSGYYRPYYRPYYQPYYSSYYVPDYYYYRPYRPYYYGAYYP